jgi:hypothetical protein
MKKLEQKGALVWAACGVMGLATVGLVVRPLLAQQAPGLTISQTSSNQFQIKITNGNSSVNYELYRTLALGDPFYPFTFYTNGILGQTNFTIFMAASEFTGFFEAAIGSDWDGDGIPNYIDAQPNSTNAGVLVITIDSPTSGANVQ